MQVLYSFVCEYANPKKRIQFPHDATPFNGRKAPGLYAPGFGRRKRGQAVWRISQTWNPMNVAQFLRLQVLLNGRKMSNGELLRDGVLVLDACE